MRFVYYFLLYIGSCTVLYLELHARFVAFGLFKRALSFSRILQACSQTLFFHHSELALANDERLRFDLVLGPFGHVLTLRAISAIIIIIIIVIICLYKKKLIMTCV